MVPNVSGTERYSEFIYIFKNLDRRGLTYMMDKFFRRHFSYLSVAFGPSNYLYHYNTQAEYVKLV